MLPPDLYAKFTASNVTILLTFAHKLKLLNKIMKIMNDHKVVEEILFCGTKVLYKNH